MADKPAPITDPGPAWSDEPPPSWVQAIREELSNALGALFDKGKAEVVEAPAVGKGDPARPAPVDVEGQVRKAISDVEDAKKAAAAAEAGDAEKAALKAEVERLKGLVEKAPREFKPVTRFMWGGDDG